MKKGNEKKNLWFCSSEEEQMVEAHRVESSKLSRTTHGVIVLIGENVWLAIRRIVGSNPTGSTYAEVAQSGSLHVVEAYSVVGLNSTLDTLQD